MKTCLCCGSDALDGAMTCHACGQASWSEAKVTEPVAPLDTDALEPESPDADGAPESERQPEQATGGGRRRRGPR